MSALYPYQEVGAKWLAERRHALLGDDPGLGKSAQTVAAADLIGAKRILVVCPGIGRDHWARQWMEWQQISRTIQIVWSAADARHIYADVGIVSYALTPRIADLRAHSWDLLVLDECQALKTPGAARTKAIYGTHGIARHARRVWLLSGTPAPNHPAELWAHYRVCFGGKLSYQEFVDRFCTTRETQWGRQITGANRAHTAELARLLRPHVLRRRQAEVLPDLPPLRWGLIPVTPASVPPQPELSPQELAILGRLEAGEALSVVDQMALATLRRWTGVAKAPAVVELILAELESIEKLVVFAVHRQVIQMLAQGVGSIAAVIDGSTPQAERQRLIDAFQTAPLPRVLICQITVAGTALTLHRASRVLFAESSWVPKDVVQAAARCHRIGQAHSVLASVVSLAGSIDEVVAAVLIRKARELAELENLISPRSAAA